MSGTARRSVLIVLLAAASGFMAYRLFLQDGVNSGTSPQGKQAPGGSGASAAAGGAGSAARSAAARGAEAEIDPTLRLDLLNNSRAVSYTGSRRNIFVIGAAATRETGNGSSGGNAAAGKLPGGTAPSVVEPPSPPPPPPPVVIPLKFYGIAERSGGAQTKALLTSGDTILIAQVGQIVAQHFKITRIGLAKLELEDIRDHTTHEIPLEEGAAGSPPPAAAAAVPR